MSRDVRKALMIAKLIGNNIGLVNRDVLGQPNHMAYGGRNKENDNIWWHGSASGDYRGGTSGLHLGTKAAAEDALHATIGFPAEGEWDGTRRYGDTLLAGKKSILAREENGITGHNVDAPEHDYYPHEHPSGGPVYSNREKIPFDVMPSIKPFKIVGGMTNRPSSPHDDWKANGYMKAALKKGNARNGYFYKNQGEDGGSISAVVPNGNHIEPIDNEHDLDITKAEGGYIHDPERNIRYALLLSQMMKSGATLPAAVDLARQLKPGRR